MNNSQKENHNTNRRYAVVRKKRKTVKAREIILISMTLLMCILGSISLLTNSWKIIKTSVELADLNCQTQFYNEQSRITDAMTERQEVVNKARQAIYNSDDYVISSFSCHNFFVKSVILLTAILVVIKLPAVWKFIFKLIVREMFDDRKSSRRKVMSVKKR